MYKKLLMKFRFVYSFSTKWFENIVPFEISTNLLKKILSKKKASEKFIMMKMGTKILEIMSRRPCELDWIVTYCENCAIITNSSSVVRFWRIDKKNCKSKKSKLNLHDMCKEKKKFRKPASLSLIIFDLKKIKIMLPLKK